MNVSRALCCIGAIAAAPSALAAQDSVAVIEVTATGAVERDPEIARLVLSVETSAPTASDAAHANARQMTRLVGAVKAMPRVSDVHTTSYGVTPRYDSRPNRDDLPEPAGYTVHNTVEVVVDSVALVGRVIDTALSAGANRVTGISFEIAHPDAAYAEALALAVKNARMQAEVLARSAGGHLGRVRSISTSGPVRPMGARMAISAMEATPIEPGSTSVSATVSVQFELVTDGRP